MSIFRAKAFGNQEAPQLCRLGLPRGLIPGLCKRISITCNLGNSLPFYIKAVHRELDPYIDLPVPRALDSQSPGGREKATDQG